MLDKMFTWNIAVLAVIFLYGHQTRDKINDGVMIPGYAIDVLTSNS